jgi:glycosyltransferase involved in cell wall biosynthesis
MSGTLNIFAPNWNKADSYGRVAHELSAGLSRLGVYVNAHGGNVPKNVKPYRMVIGGFILAYPTNAKEFGGFAAIGPRVAVTMFESDKLPDGWADALNEMDAAILPSPWLVEVFRDSGVKIPLHVIPLGISSAYKYVERSPVVDRPMVFMATGDSGARKGWDKSGMAFMRAFGDDPRYELHYKTRAAWPFSFENPNIKVISKEMSDRQMAALMAQADVYIFPTAGEGFGLPCREFAATGGLAITTNWGGTADDLHRWGLPIRSKGLVPAWKGEQGLEGVGCWADPDVDDLAATMKHVAAHMDYYRAGALERSKFVRKQYRWNAFAKAALKVWQEALVGYSKRAKTG